MPRRPAGPRPSPAACPPGAPACGFSSGRWRPRPHAALVPWLWPLGLRATWRMRPPVPVSSGHPGRLTAGPGASGHVSPVHARPGSGCRTGAEEGPAAVPVGSHIYSKLRLPPACPSPPPQSHRLYTVLHTQTRALKMQRPMCNRNVLAFIWGFGPRTPAQGQMPLGNPAAVGSSPSSSGGTATPASPQKPALGQKVSEGNMVPHAPRGQRRSPRPSDAGAQRSLVGRDAVDARRLVSIVCALCF